jgi:excisionase family DNA binding protein
MTDQLLTVPEVATQLRITPKTVRRWLRAGKLRGVRLGGKRVGWRIPQGEVNRLVSLPGSGVAHA